MWGERTKTNKYMPQGYMIYNYTMHSARRDYSRATNAPSYRYT